MSQTPKPKTLTESEFRSWLESDPKRLDAARSWACQMHADALRDDPSSLFDELWSGIGRYEDMTVDELIGDLSVLIGDDNDWTQIADTIAERTAS